MHLTCCYQMLADTDRFVLFQTFGDMNEINRYLRKAQALQTRLETAFEKVIKLLAIWFAILFVLTIIYCICGLCLFEEHSQTSVSRTASGEGKLSN